MTQSNAGDGDGCGLMVTHLVGISDVTDARILCVPVSASQQISVFSANILTTDTTSTILLRTTIAGAPGGNHPAPQEAVGMTVAKTVTDLALDAFPTTRPIDPNGAAEDSDPSDNEAGPDATKPAFIAFSTLENAADEGIRLLESDMPVPSEKEQYFVLQIEAAKDSLSEISFAVTHSRDQGTLEGLQCINQVVASQFISGLIVMTVNTTRPGGGKSPSEFAKEWKRKFATGAKVRMVAARKSVSDVSEAIESLVPQCCDIHTLRKKHYLTPYLVDRNKFEIDV